MNLLLAVTAETWIVTGLGFGIVLGLLVVLIYILKIFGVVMQGIATPRTKKAEKVAPQKKAEVKISPVPTDEGTMAAIAMALSEASDDDKVAVAMALHLYFNHAHDLHQTTLTMTAKPTAWNSKAFGMNNQGF